MRRSKLMILCFITLVVIGGVIILMPEKLETKCYKLDLPDGNEEDINLIKVCGMKNKFVQYKLNENIKNDFLLWMNDYFKEEPRYFADHGARHGFVSNQYFYFIMDYTIGFSGRKSYYCTVYSSQTGERVYLDDLFNLDDGFVAAVKLYGKEYTYDMGESLITSYGYENESEEYIAGFLNRVAMKQSKWNILADESEKKSYYKPDFLITEENLYLSVPIPLDKLEGYLKVPKWW